ncbi:chemotaxis protein [Bradyrhizobium jicamae]|uniref:Blue-light-activated histidine kinase n=2 Tax=Bradyrhizobium jicamae TaxID=280332 RepID=A0A0R3LRN1_9BRAD|nr:chemotaxis protein [Bradyrhizobium jicamae]
MQVIENNERSGRVPTNGAKPIVVGMGASAGGVKALQAFFQALPDEPGAAFVVVIHLDPDRPSEMAAILGLRTKMPVVQVGAPQRMEANHVYVISPNRRLQITDSEIAASEFVEPRGQRAPIDLFFRSLAEQHGDGFAVILTGAGSDGAIGIKAVKESGGLILVQDPGEAEHDSMPRSAISTGIVDFVLPLSELANRLVELIKDKESFGAAAPRQFSEDILRRILAHVRVRTGHDFAKYKRATVVRRIARRMQVMRCDDPAEYYNLLRDHADEATALLGDLLISVTTFFRDAEVFDALKDDVLPQLFQISQPSEPIRVWVAGCATGEEAYTIAMLLLEEASRHDLRPPIQIFGSDLDARSLSVAREGRYPAAIEADINEERLRRFFVREGDQFRVRQELRDTVLFASHSVLKDPPFSRINLISCRNLLIYLDRELQQQVCSTFHYALNPGGFLLVGSSETADSPPGLFRTVDRKARIYQSTVQTGDKPRLLPRLLGSMGALQDHAASARASLAPSAMLSEAASHRKAIEKVAPPSVLVDATHRVIHLSENAGRYLQPSGGPLSGDVVDLVRPELRFELRSALHRVFENPKPSLSLPILVRFNGSSHRVLLHVKPVLDDNGERPHEAVIIFIEGEAVDPASMQDFDKTGGVDEVVRRLTEELQLTQGRLRSTREESEATNEELRAANEELQSINEEYRSTSEELETSKEELQSINEELQTVNTELKLKLEAVSRGHSDLQNLMAATDFGTLFLDAGLRIKRFTRQVTDLISITPNDEGRPVTDFAHRLEYDDLVKDAQSVLSHLAPITREVHSRMGRWFDIRLRPYRTVDDKIDGVVITFVDITDRKAWETRQALLLGELTHRVKNTLTVVQSIAHLSLRSAASSSEFVAQFDGRLSALAKSHNLLVESNWQGVDLKALVRQQLDPYTVGSQDRLKIEGEAVVLPPDLASSFGLVLHELTTNAAKYGALSQAEGKVFLNWTASVRNQKHFLKFVWKERGGPRIEEPDHVGFGTAAIDRGIPEADVKREYLPEGLLFTITFPVTEVNGSRQ